jgi:hypothetical protein
MSEWESSQAAHSTPTQPIESIESFGRRGGGAHGAAARAQALARRQSAPGRNTAQHAARNTDHFGVQRTGMPL